MSEFFEMSNQALYDFALNGGFSLPSLEANNPRFKHHKKLFDEYLANPTLLSQFFEKRVSKDALVSESAEVLFQHYRPHRIARCLVYGGAFKVMAIDFIQSDNQLIGYRITAREAFGGKVHIHYDINHRLESIFGAALYRGAEVSSKRCSFYCVNGLYSNVVFTEIPEFQTEFGLSRENRKRIVEFRDLISNPARKTERLVHPHPAIRILR